MIRFLCSSTKKKKKIREISNMLIIKSNLVIIFVIVLVFFVLFSSENDGKVVEEHVRFSYPMKNLTVIVGRTAILTCVIEELNNYRVAWIKIETKSILAIHNRILVSDDRLVATHNNFDTWTLTIKRVAVSDRGEYMCQVNSNPVVTQTAFLEVHIPPDIIHEETSGDLIVYEGESVKLACKARGYPAPKISWRRDNEQPLKFINYQNNQSNELIKKYYAIDGTLVLINLTRYEMGNYFCIASNGVPPAISKTIKIFIYFRPVVYTLEEKIGAKLHTKIMLNCCIEAYPKTVNSWTKSNGNSIKSNGKYEIRESIINSFTISYALIIANVTATDILHSYKCSSRNSIGFSEKEIKLYDIDFASSSEIQTDTKVSGILVEGGGSNDQNHDKNHKIKSESDEFAKIKVSNGEKTLSSKANINSFKVFCYSPIYFVVINFLF